MESSFLDKNAVAEIFEGKQVEALAAGGEGVVHHKGLCVFVDMTVPGDIITGRITETHKKFARADLVEVLHPSQDRVAPPCPYYSLCGGCSQQHIAYKAQVAGKVQILQETLRRIGELKSLPPITIREGEPWEYRNRVQLHSEGFSLGYKARSSDNIVCVEDCLVADPAIRHALGKGGIKISAPRTTIYARADTFLCGRQSGTVEICGRRLHLDSAVFFQSNGSLLEILIGDILAAVDESDMPACDLYCGVGTFASFLHDRLEYIDLVEENTLAVSLARKNVKGAGVSFYTGSASKWRSAKSYGFIIVDPPRSGLSPAVRGYLLLKHPPLLLYVSCNPATFARDIRDIRAGYTLSDLFFYDFYPQTPHIEIMAVLRA